MSKDKIEPYSFRIVGTHLWTTVCSSVRFTWQRKAKYTSWRSTFSFKWSYKPTSHVLNSGWTSKQGTLKNICWWNISTICSKKFCRFSTKIFPLEKKKNHWNYSPVQISVITGKESNSWKTEESVNLHNEHSQNVHVTWYKMVSRHYRRGFNPSHPNIR